ncbi:Rho termination factor N-terminal domain-containing protein [Leptolyngbyaceae cyanobacterium UHCC 1019]
MSLDDRSIRELRRLASARGIEKYSRKSKAELIALLQASEPATPAAPVIVARITIELFESPQG